MPSSRKSAVMNDSRGAYSLITRGVARVHHLFDGVKIYIRDDE
jgi:hypothetical protein